MLVFSLIPYSLNTSKNLMDSKGMNKNRLSVLTGVKFDTIQKYYNGDVYRIDVDVLAKFCYALNCNVNDIVEYNKK
ncbi:MAG: helix-turn-helix transcriptional regulator [Bacilli bacterium]